MHFAYLAAILALSVLMACTLARRGAFFVLIPTFAWVSVLFLAFLNLLAFQPLRNETIFVTFIFLALLTVLTSISHAFVRAGLSSSTSSSETESSISWTLNYRFIQLLRNVLLVFYLIYFGKSCLYFTEHGIPADYRMLAMGYGTASVIFTSDLELFLFSSIARGALFIFLCLSAFRFIQHGRYDYLLIAGFLMALDSVVTFGRFYLYVFLFVVGVCAVIRGELPSPRGILVVLATLALMIFLSTLRYDCSVSPHLLISKYIVGYHTYGLFLLDQLIGGELEYAYWFGGATFGGLLFLLSKPIALAGLDLPIFLQSQTVVEQASLVWLGGHGENAFFANAFYTLVADMFFDGGLIGVVIISSLIAVAYGAIIALFGHRRDARWFSLLLIFAIALYFSVLKNQFNQLYIVLAILFFVFCPPRFYSHKIESET